MSLLKKDQPKGAKKKNAGVGKSLRSFATFTMGIGAGATTRHHVIPPGFVLTVDKRTGYRYVVPDEEANGVAPTSYVDNRRRIMMENGEWPTLCGPKRDLALRFGTGVYLYFDFIRFTTFMNLLLSAIVLVNLIAHFVIDGWTNFFQVSQTIALNSVLNGTLNMTVNETVGNFTLFANQSRDSAENFFVSSYGPPVYSYWIWTSIAITILIFLFGPALSLRIKYHFKRYNLKDTEDKFVASKLDIIMTEEGVPENAKGFKIGRVMVSYFFFLVILAVTTVIWVILNMLDLYMDASNY